MIDRRSEPRTRLNISGTILIDEHQTKPCIVSDRSERGIRVTMPSAEDLPDAFILTVDDTGEVLVCRATWRSADQVGCQADVLVNVWVAERALQLQLAGA